MISNKVYWNDKKNLAKEAEAWNKYSERYPVGVNYIYSSAGAQELGAAGEMPERNLKKAVSKAISVTSYVIRVTSIIILNGKVIITHGIGRI